MNRILDPYDWMGQFSPDNDNSSRKGAKYLAYWVALHFNPKIIEGKRIVSVGTGVGSFEMALSNYLSLPITCIDPVNKSQMEINYSFVDEYIRSCYGCQYLCYLLILCWPSNDEFYENQYDFEAIEKLSPKFIFITYGKGAGGEKLRAWLNSPSIAKFKPDITSRTSYLIVDVIKKYNPEKIALILRQI